MTIKLRENQLRQLEFVKNKIKGRLPLAVEAPTGSGKSFVILQFCKEYIEEHPGEDFTLVVTTGFNNLVYRLASDCELFGIKPIVWLGTGHTLCGIKYEKEHGYFPSIEEVQAFTPDEEYHPDYPDCFLTCHKAKDCLYNKAKQELKKFGPKVVVTNHSSYLLALKNGFFEPTVTVVDESHTFASFYENYLKVEVSAEEIKQVQDVLSEVKDPTFLLFKRAVEKGQKIHPNLFRQVKAKIEESGVPNAKAVAEKLQEFAVDSASPDRYYSITPRGMSVTKFWSKFDVRQEDIPYVLFSATQDEYTLDMFGVPRNRLYVDDSVLVDYSKSEFLVVNKEDFVEGFQAFLKETRAASLKKGLVLSTTNKDVKSALELGEVYGYEVTSDFKYFLKKEKDVVLVGSRAFFQGVDIPSVQFVGLNRIPFPTYDDKFRAHAEYLKEVAGIDPWKKFTVPKVKNDMIQVTGRLWRKPGDSGVVGVFDPRLLGRFKYMADFVLNTRKGIKYRVIE